MSTRTVVSIQCDEPGCAAVFACGLDRAWDTREQASRAGWSYVVPERAKRVGPVKSFDFCPTHSEPWAFCNEEACAWAGEMSQLVVDEADPQRVTHCPKCGSTAILEELRRADAEGRHGT